MTSFTCPVCQATSYHPEDAKQGYCGRCKAFTRDRAFLLPPEPRSWGVLRGDCGWGIAEDVRCDKPAEHEPPHRAHDPSGSGDWIEFTDDGTVTDRGRFRPPPLLLEPPVYDTVGGSHPLPLLLAVTVVVTAVALAAAWWLA